VITSNAGWDTIKHVDFLKEIVGELKKFGTRVSIFVDPSPAMAEGAAQVGADRIEMYTEPYAKQYQENREEAVKPYVETAQRAKALGLGINAGHDLDLQNLKYLKQSIPYLDEVSIGHALISDALYFGLENTIQLYLRQLKE
jgi:pyridoxine 5-phosphate synthase